MGRTMLVFDFVTCTIIYITIVLQIIFLCKREFP